MGQVGEPQRYLVVLLLDNGRRTLVAHKTFSKVAISCFEEGTFILLQARTQDFAQEGATCSRRGLQVTRRPPRRLEAPRRSGTPGYQGPLGSQGPRKPGAFG